MSITYKKHIAAIYFFTYFQLKALGFTNVSALDISQKSLDFSEKKGIYKKLFCVDVGTDGMPFNDSKTFFFLYLHIL